MSGPAGERGETLLEVLVAVVIMGVAVVAIVGGLYTGILMSDIHRKQATAGTVVRDYAESIENSVTTGTTNVTCGMSIGSRTVNGYTASVTGVRYWDGTAWQTTCGGNTGLQQLTVQAASGDGRAVERLVIVVRRPCTVGGATC